MVYILEIISLADFRHLGLLCVLRSQPIKFIQVFSDIKFSDNLWFSDYFAKTIFQFTT